jgi:hypothetical protein
MLSNAFSQYKIALIKHRNECDLAEQNYGKWNFKASSNGDLRNAIRDLLFQFNCQFFLDDKE